jgi:hypothetical protein
MQPSRALRGTGRFIFALGVQAVEIAAYLFMAAVVIGALWVLSRLLS